MRDRFTLKRTIPLDAIQFSNNDFEVSIAGWDQFNTGSDVGFSWNNPSSARASGSGADTVAIGQDRPDDSSKNWTPGTYTVAITATNTSTGGSAPFVSFLRVFGSDTGAALDDQISVTGDSGQWTVGAGESTHEVIFTLSQEYKKIFFKFDKSGVDSGYNVVFTINKIELINVQDATDDQEIAEPGAWQGHTIKLERHPEFHSLIETLFTDERFIFVGDDNEDGIGGADFIRDVEQEDGFDAVVQFVAETAEDDVNYEEYFTGLLQIEGLEELPENEVEVPVIRDNFWSTFIKRFDIPVDVTKNVTLNGNPCEPLEPVTVMLTSQKIRKKYSGIIYDTPDYIGIIGNGEYFQIDFDKEELDEIDTKHFLPRVDNVELPTWMFTIEEAGDYNFDIELCGGENIVGGDIIASNTRYQIFIKFNDDAEIQFTENNVSFGDDDQFTRYTYSDTVALAVGDVVRIYGKRIDIGGGSFCLFGMNPESYVPLGYFEPSTIDASFYTLINPHLTVVADTVYPDTEVQGYWAHDLAAGILARIDLGENAFYSEWLGSPLTKTRQYAEAGCASRFFLTKGLFVRGYTLTDDEDDPTQRYSLQEKGFSISFKKWWEGMNPIFNLGLGYETLEESPEKQVIRVEQKAHFYQA